MKKLIPHVYMSKDDFPLTLSPHDVLEKMFEFFQSWKSRLYDMISYNSLPPSGVDVEVKPPNIAIKQEPKEEDSPVPRPASPERYSWSGASPGRALLEETRQILAQAGSSCSSSVSPPREREKKKRERSRSSSGGEERRGQAGMKSFKEAKFSPSEETVRRRRAEGHLSQAKYQSSLLRLFKKSQYKYQFDLWKTGSDP